jgi:zinc transport system ATP-binding protein
MTITDHAPLIELKNAGVNRQSRWLMRNVDLSVSRGEIVTLIGPNGSGKSTTVKTAIGLLQPDEGVADRQKDLKIGYVPQKFHVDATLPLTVKQLITLTAHHEPNQIEEMLQKVGLKDHMNSPVQALSGGELQRALLARAFINSPDLLVLDEPVQGVDFAGEAALYDLIDQHRTETNCGILLISHDLHVVMAKTDRVLCLNGHVCCTGTPAKVINDPQYLSLFGARAAGQIAIYQHQHDHSHLPDGRVQHADGSITDHCHHEDGHHDHDHNHAQDKDAS